MPLTVTPTTDEQQQPPPPTTEQQQSPPPTTDDRPPEQSGAPKPFYSKQIPDPPKEGEEWKRFVPQALAGLYPHLRAGEDYVWGKKDFGGQDEMISWDEKYAPADMGKVEEIAKKLASRDPYLSYKPLPPLHGGSQLGAGETPKPNESGILPPNVAVSEVNPQTDAKVPSQPYTPPLSPETPNETNPEQPTEP